MARWCLTVRRVRFFATSYITNIVSHAPPSICSHARILKFFDDMAGKAGLGSSSTNLRNTLLVHSSVQHGPGYSSRVLALKEQGFGLAILESEDLAVTTDVEFAL
jgi:hypothetical protein